MSGNSRIAALPRYILWMAGCLAFCLLSGCLHSTVPRDVEAGPLVFSAWQTVLPSSPAARKIGERWSFFCPFPDGADRHAWDTDLSLDLSPADGLELVYTLENPEAFRGISWYARSGSGWFAASLPLHEGFQRAWLPFSDFVPEGNPVGWSSIHGFRLSPWSAKRGEGVFVLHAIRPRRTRIGVVIPSRDSAPDAREQVVGQRTGQQWLSDLARLSLYATPMTERDLSALDPQRFPVLVLPYNPSPSPAMQSALSRYVRDGGRIVSCYNSDPKIAALIGVTPGRWISAGTSRRWHSLSFARENWKGPARVYQPSTPNLLASAPLAPDARVLAGWKNAEGNLQPEPALIVSPRGAWFSYLLGTSDDAARLRMLAFLLEPFLPQAPLIAAQRRVEDALNRADKPMDTFLASLEQPSPVAAAARRARKALADGKAAEAWTAGETLAAAIDRALAARVSLPADFPLGIWDHSGQGLYPGNWPQTLAELSDAGVTDLFVFCPRNGPLPVSAVEAAAPLGLRIHAWHIGYNVDSLGEKEIRNLEQKNRLQRSIRGQTARWLCPTREDTFQEERSRVIRLAETPGLSGLHLDYFRYPDAHHCFCARCRASFEKHIGARVESWPGDVREGAPLRNAFLDWRADQISRQVREISKALRRRHPSLRISAAVWPDVKMVKPVLGQDWPRWLNEGWVDFLVPMSYTENAWQLSDWTRSQTALPGATNRIWAGLGVSAAHTRLEPPEVLRQIRAAREAGAAGIVVFDLNATVRANLFPLLRILRKENARE